MITWNHHELPHLSAEDIAGFCHLIGCSKPEYIIYVGPYIGLHEFLSSVSSAPVLSKYSDTPDTSKKRPSAGAQTFMQSARVLVCLEECSTGDVFAWASLLPHKDSTIVSLGPKPTPQECPDFSVLDCARLQDTEESMPGTSVVVVSKGKSAEPTQPSPLARRTRPKRPLRTVFLGDLNYSSLYRAGVIQGMTIHGAWHRDVSLRNTATVIDKQVREMRPDIIFTHMLLWPPENAPVGVADLLGLTEQWRRQFGCVVIIHDGDPRPWTRFPHDISRSVDMALCNHSRQVPDWHIPSMRWPYAALMQDAISDPLPEFRADLAFAGLLRSRSDDDMYGPRTRCVEALVDRKGMRVYSVGDVGYNNRMLLADVAPSCIAMVGFGRPECPGWIDTRVFTVPGAGGVLIHDDVGGILEPDVHYVHCMRYDVDSVIGAFEHARHHQDRLRHAAFKHVQANHTYRQRCAEVLDAIYKG